MEGRISVSDNFGAVSSTVGRLMCAFNRHRPVRREVRWGGFGYVGACKYCGKDILRTAGGVWHSDSSAHGEK